MNDRITWCLTVVENEYKNSVKDPLHFAILSLRQRATPLMLPLNTHSNTSTTMLHGVFPV